MATKDLSGKRWRLTSNRAKLLAPCAAAVAGLGLWSDAPAATIRFDGGAGNAQITLQTGSSWEFDNVPTAFDEALLDNTIYTLPGTLTSTSALSMRDLLINSSTLNTLATNVSTTTNTTLTLGGGTSVAAVAAGGAAGDLLLLGTNVTGPVTFGGNINTGAGRLLLAFNANGNINVVNSAATLNIVSNIGTNAYSLTKTGAGTLTLSGTNSFGNANTRFTLEQGTLNVNSATALGAANNLVVLNGGTINNTSGGAITLTNNQAFVINALNFTGSNDLNIGSGLVNLGDAAGTSRGLTVGAGVLTLGGTIINGATATGITKAGAGVLQLTGVSRYEGNTVINAGSVRLGNANALFLSTAQSSVANGLSFATGIGSFRVGGIVGSANQLLEDTASGAVTLQAGGNNLSSSYSGAFSGVGSFAKIGTGTLTISGAHVHSGGTAVNTGTLLATQNSGTPLGTGDIALNGGTLNLSPTGSAADVTLTGANAVAGSQLILGGGGTLVLNRGTNTSLSFIAGHTAPSGQVITRANHGSLVITPTALADLGVTEKFLVTGTAPGATANGELVNLPVIIQASSSNTTGHFAKYDAVNGLVATPLSSYTARAASFITTAAEIADVSGTFTLAGDLTNVISGLRVGAGTMTIGTGKTLLIGNAGSTVAPIILNGGVIAAETQGSSAIDFGASEGVIYTSTDNGVISAKLMGSGGLTIMGPGAVTLSNGNNSFSGDVVMNQGTLAAGANTNLGAAANGLVFNGGTFRLTSSLSTGRVLTVNAGGATIDTNGFNFTQNLANGNLQIAGIGDVTKTGAGTLSFGSSTNGGASGFFGNWYVKAGTLSGSASGSALGGSRSTIFLGDDTPGSTLSATFSVSNNLTFANPIVAQAGTSGTLLVVNSNTNTFSGAITLANNLTLRGQASGGTTYSGVVSGYGNLTLQNTNGSPTATMDFNGPMNQVGAILNNGSGVAIASVGASIGAGISSITQTSNTSPLRLTGNNRYFTGSVNLEAGRLLLGSASALGQGTLNINGGTLEASTSNLFLSLGNSQGSVNVTGAGQTTATASNTTGISAGQFLSGSQFLGATYVTGVTAHESVAFQTPLGGTGAPGATASGTAAFALGAMNAININNSFIFAGTNSLNLGSGAVTLNGANITITNTGSGTLTQGGAFNSTGGSNLTLATTLTGGFILTGQLNNTGTVATNTTGAGNGAIVLAGGLGSNVTDFTHGGAGNLTVTQGALANSGNVTFNGTAASTVAVSSAINSGGVVSNTGTTSGTTTLSGQIGANVDGVVQNSSTSLLMLSNAANSYGTTQVAAGTLEVASTGKLGTGNVQVAGAAILKLNGNGTIDQINDSATLTVAEGGLLDLAFVGTESVGTLVLGSTTFNYPIVFTAANGYTEGGAEFAAYFGGSTGNLSVPEPGTLGLLVIGAGGLLARRRRTR